MSLPAIFRRVATVIGHRGLWDDGAARNSLLALRRCFAAGFGTETDVRDRCGEVVVSHDPADASAVSIQPVVEAWRLAGRPGPLALNIKADGLHRLLATTLVDDDWRGVFFFDGSIPDLVAYGRAGLPFFTRQSDLEPQPHLYAEAVGVWIDGFVDETWISARTLEDHLAAGKRVCLVSPELHGRDHTPAWIRWSAWDVLSDPRVLVCTDRPLDADAVFAGPR